MRHFTPPTLLAIALALISAAAAPAQDSQVPLERKTNDPRNPIFTKPTPRPTVPGVPPEAYGTRDEGEMLGQVTSAETSRPVADCLVVVGTKVVRTDAEGRFRVGRLPYGEHAVTARAEGFRSAFKVILFYGRNTPLSIHLSPSAVGAGDREGSADALVAALKEFHKGVAALAKGDARDGAARLEKAVNIYPELHEARLLLGTTYMDARDWGRAESALQRLRERDPRAAPAHFALAELYRRQGRQAEAEGAARRGLELDGQSARGRLTLALIHFETGDMRKAAAEAAAAAALEPNLAEAHLVAGSALANVGEREQALTEFEMYLRLEPIGRFAEKAREIILQLRREKALPGQP